MLLAIQVKRFWGVKNGGEPESSPKHEHLHKAVRLFFSPERPQAHCCKDTDDSISALVVGKISDKGYWRWTQASDRKHVLPPAAQVSPSLAWTDPAEADSRTSTGKELPWPPCSV